MVMKRNLDSASSFDLDDYFADAPMLTQRALRAACQTLEYRPGTLLFSEEEPAKGVFLLKNGELETFILGANGREVILRKVKPGDVLGVNETFSAKRHKASARTISQCEVRFIPAFAFRHFLQEHSGAGIGLAKLLSADLEKAYSRIRAMRG
jgi:CRP-like cAMP-binding protein